MIDCPICHVKNHDDARFCAECGQRLGAGSPQAPAPQAGNAPEPPRQPSARLHSPLLGGGEPAEPASDVNRLRQMSSRPRDEVSPILPETPYKNPFDPRHSGAESPTQADSQSNSQRRPRLHSPLLSGDEFADEPQPDQADYEAQSGRGLRSPLLGGGGGGRYTGEERRAPTYQEFAGQERRRPHLHSPLLHNTDSYYIEEAALEEDEEPIDENNPNVLRSPLLAAKRPLNDRPPVNSPSSSNIKTPARPTNSPEAMQFAGRPSPTSSYTSLQSINSNSSAVASARETAAPPPAPATVATPPATVPAAFQNFQSPPPAAASAPSSPPPSSGTASGGMRSAPPEPPHVAEPVRKTTPKLLSDDAHEHYDEIPHHPSAPPSPLPMLIGAVAIVLLLAKLWVVSAFFGTEWRNTMFLVVDQLVGLALIVCLIVLAFSRRS